MPLLDPGARGRRIIGVDETGRGSCFGPLLTCAVRFPAAGLPPELVGELDDSKALSERKRTRLYALLVDQVEYAFGAASSAEVDRLNPLRATMLAMRRAVCRLPAAQDCWVVVDGNRMPDLDQPGQCLVKADSLVPEVMAASILAKNFRDDLIRRLAGRYPGYGLERHAGYGTAAHFAAIRKMGASRHHRTSYLGRVLVSALGTPALENHDMASRQGLLPGF